MLRYLIVTLILNSNFSMAHEAGFLCLGSKLYMPNGEEEYVGSNKCQSLNF
jgi:hypothetical protein